MPTVMHDEPQKPFAGALLSLTTAALWGVLPVALKELLSVMDAGTVVWYRFLGRGAGHSGLAGSQTESSGSSSRIGESAVDDAYRCAGVMR